MKNKYCIIFLLIVLIFIIKINKKENFDCYTNKYELLSTPDKYTIGKIVQDILDEYKEFTNDSFMVYEIHKLFITDDKVNVIFFATSDKYNALKFNWVFKIINDEHLELHDFKIYDNDNELLQNKSINTLNNKHIYGIDSFTILNEKDPNIGLQNLNRIVTGYENDKKFENITYPVKPTVDEENLKNYPLPIQNNSLHEYIMKYGSIPGMHKIHY